MMRGLKSLATTEHSSDSLKNRVLRRVVGMLLGGDFENGGDGGVKLTDRWSDTIRNLFGARNWIREEDERVLGLDGMGLKAE